jgi:hypothetical protein
MQGQAAHPLPVGCLSTDHEAKVLRPESDIKADTLALLLPHETIQFHQGSIIRCAVEPQITPLKGRKRFPIDF